MEGARSSAPVSTEAFARRPSVRGDIFPSRPANAISSRTLPFPSHSRKPSISGESARARGIASTAGESDSDEEGVPRHRAAKVKYTPALPPGAEWLLLTMAPPSTPVETTTTSLPLPAKLRRTMSHASSQSQSSLPSVEEGEESFMKKVFGGLMSPMASWKPSKPASEQMEKKFVGSNGSDSDCLSSRSEVSLLSLVNHEPASRHATSDLNGQHSATISSGPKTSQVFPSRPTRQQEAPALRIPGGTIGYENRREKVLTRLDLFGRNPNYHREEGMSSLSRTAYATPSNDSSIFGSGGSSPLSSSPSILSSGDLYPSDASRPLTPPLSPPSSVCTSATKSSRSIVNDDKLLAILSRAEQAFGTRVCMITVLTADKQRVLASRGMPEGVDALPRGAEFYGEAFTSEPSSLVVLDASKDPRFKNNILTVVLSARFYASAPVFAPDKSATDKIPIGTLCICDARSRTSFGQAERAMLTSLATEVSEEIEAWVADRSTSPRASLAAQGPFPTFKRQSLPFPSKPNSAKQIRDWQSSVGPGSSPTDDNRSLLAPSLPPSPPQSIREYSPSLDEVDSAPSPAIAPYAIDDRRSSLPKAPPKNPSRGRRSKETSKVNSWAEDQGEIKEEVANQATGEFRTLSEHSIDDQVAKVFSSCSLSLVYLVRLTLSTPSPRLTLLSSAGLSHHQAKPSFDPVLHIKALRAPEGGLLYRNPNSPTSTKPGKAYAAGILLPVTSNADFGWVVAGYTKDWDREFVEEDLAKMAGLADTLAGLLEV